MVDRETLAAHGIDADTLRKAFEGTREDRATRPDGDKVNAFIDRMVFRCRGGRDLNLEHYRTFYAMDAAWDAAFNQITPTLRTTLMDRSADSPDVAEILRTSGYDFSDVVREVRDEKTPEKASKRVVAPAFFKITVPLCMSVVKARLAKLTSDRRQVPFLKYDPVISDEVSRLKCALITARTEVMSEQYNYFDTFKQACFQMLHYAECLQFPIEEWHSESQWHPKDSPYPADEDAEPSEKKIGSDTFKKVITKEGLRYHLPHPARVYYDRSHPVNTLNTSTGCAYAGYWKVLTFTEVMRQENYYNLDVIGYSDFWSWFNGVKAHDYWVNTLKGCSLKFPGEESANPATSRLDSEKNVARWYSKDWADKPVVITEHFERVIPSEIGLGDYDCPVWIRCTLAADDTVIYAAPVCFDPAVLWWGYDYVHYRTHNASMTLECLPFQDAFTNLLAQHLLSVKQNLANITFIDTDLVDEKELKRIENLGERWYRSLNFVKSSFDKLFKRKAATSGGQNPIAQAVISHKFPQQNTTDTLNAMRTILDTMERVLGISSQEVGQAASHEQTREEIRTVTANTSTRFTLTSGGVDSTLNAWKVQLYNAEMAYGRMSFYAQVPMEQPLDATTLGKLGFTARSKHDEKTKRQVIEADKAAVAYESFASERDSTDRVNDVQTGQQMLSLLEQALASPMLGPAIGADQALKWINAIARFLGFPRDFRLENSGQGQTMQQQMGGAIQQLKQYVDQNFQTLEQDVQGGLKQVMQKDQQQDSAIAQLNQLLGRASALPDPTLPQPSSLDANPAQMAPGQSGQPGQ